MQYSHVKVNLALFIAALVCIKASYKLFNPKALDKLLSSFRRRRGGICPKCPILNQPLALND